MGTPTQPPPEPGDPSRRVQIGCAAAFVLLLGLAVIMHEPGARLAALKGLVQDGMNGPYRAVPPPLPAEPPRTAVTLLDVSEHYPHVFGALGLKVERSGISSVRAVDLRTHWTYWTYREHSREVESLVDDRATGDVYITWRDRDSGHVQRIDRVDVARGKVRWRHDVRRDIDRFGSREGESNVDSAVAVARPDGSPTVALVSFFMAAGFDEATGERRWAVPQPPACSLRTDPRTLDGTAGVVAIVQSCAVKNRAERYLLGLDAATGAQRWRVPFPRADFTGSFRKVVAAPGGRLAVDVSDRPVLLDARTGRPVKGGAALASSIGDGGVAQGATTTVRSCDLQEKDQHVVQYGWCGHDVRTGRRLWAQAAPDGLWGGDPPTVADGRAYVLAVPEDWHRAPATAYRFGVLDQRTGAWLARVPLPMPRGEDVSGSSSAQIEEITDGMVVLAYPDGRYALLAGAIR
ncbi:outer membrane protein assembly factor BamB family protein [Actinomadura fibrosa]|uniref:PQQ-binding-like beta-propeller repeat protein n=1 Tax=Actinomadura fibrosa TaxID=111802 RepID=A0ABW2XR71_9ACTN|nr:PQQ-binding-like beta-propeller repeat protein [Actinomadura fibrosa]